MSRYVPERQAVRLRNGSVTAFSAGKATVSLDGASIVGVPVYGPAPAVGAKVLLFEQGGSLTALGNAVSLIAELRAEVAELRSLIERSH